MNQSWTPKKAFLALTILIIVALVAIYLSNFSEPKEHLLIPAEQVKEVRQQLQEPAPNLTKTEEATIRKELAAPPSKKLTEEEIQKIREQLSR
jgi:hypothetical protein